MIVQGDTDSALAGALAANATGLPLVHVEAGLRSYDRAMPEEHNRVLVDHVSDLLAAPTPVAVANLHREGIAGEQVLCCGNTVVEAVRRQLPGPVERAGLLARFGLRPAAFVLATIHRPENTDDAATLARVLRELGTLALRRCCRCTRVPRRPCAARGWRACSSRWRIVEPLDGATFLGLAAEAALLVSDSGGVQEEVTVLGRPLVVVRRSTERPEAFEHFATLAAPGELARAASRYLDDVAGAHRRLRSVPSPFGDGTASRTIADAVTTRYC